MRHSIRTNFEILLDKYRVDYKGNGRSVIIRECPSCGKNKSSVWLIRPENDGLKTGGMCWVCGVKFSTYSFLVAQSPHIPKSQIIEDLGGSNQQAPDDSMFDFQLNFEYPEHDFEQEYEDTPEAQIPTSFFPIDSWPKHPAAVYARSRGLHGPLTAGVYIDTASNAVAFPIHIFYEDQSKLIGFQKRFVSKDAPVKTKTDANVPRRKALIRFGNPEHPMCIVEGPFDAVAAAHMGFYGVATMGATVTKTQVLEIIKDRYRTPSNDMRLYLGFDTDDAGERGAREVANLLDYYGITGFKRLTPSRPGEDLNSMLALLQQSMTMQDLYRIVPEWHWDGPSLQHTILGW